MMIINKGIYICFVAQESEEEYGTCSAGAVQTVPVYKSHYDKRTSSEKRRLAQVRHLKLLFVFTYT